MRVDHTGHDDVAACIDHFVHLPARALQQLLRRAEACNQVAANQQAAIFELATCIVHRGDAGSVLDQDYVGAICYQLSSALRSIDKG
jgi:prephenate dehydrogenase